MIVVDTTVLVYAKGSQHPLRGPCRELVAAVAERRVDAATTVEVIQEFVHVRARRRARPDAAALGRGYAEIFDPLLEVTPADLRAGLDLFESHPGLGAFDAVLAAAARSAGATALVSADTAFAALGGELRHVVPDAAGVAELLGS